MIREKLSTKYARVPLVIFLVAGAVAGATGYLFLTGGGTSVRNPATGTTLVEGGSLVLSIEPPTTLSENANTWFKIGVVIRNTTDFDIEENFRLTYDRYKYVRPASGKAHWNIKWKNVVAWTRDNVVIHPNSEVRFGVPFALEEGYYVFELGLK